tara:strand:+ start:13128 stop:13880 length:753 start_codon:yes stop_codon:yes gene_type:complete
MISSIQLDKESVVVLYKGGRLPKWSSLTDKQQADYSKEHVDLMLSVAKKHGLKQLEGHKLLGPIGPWQRFWTIEFPTFEGAEEWISAEMEPPYGRYGYYEYYFSRRITDEFLTIAPVDKANSNPETVTTPTNNPILAPDYDSFIVICFERWLPGYDVIDPKERGDQDYHDLLKTVASEYNLMRLEGYQLTEAQSEWHRVWIAEFPNIEGVKAWIDTGLQSPHNIYNSKQYYVANKWAPDYFTQWIPTNNS